jgi:hypothetical protein
MDTVTAVHNAYAKMHNHRAVAVRLRLPLTYVMLVLGLIDEAQYERYTRAA